MTATLDDVAKKKAGEVSAEQRAAAELVRLAKEQGLESRDYSWQRARSHSPSRRRN